MVCHQTKPRQPHRHFFLSLPHETNEGSEIVLVVEDIAATIAPVQDMVNIITARSSGCTWHSLSITPTKSPVK